MNKSKLEWADYTWNPITGCRYNCNNCYADKMQARFAGNTKLNKMAKADYRLVAAPDGSEMLYVLDKPMLNETGRILLYPFGFEPTYHRYKINDLDKVDAPSNYYIGAISDMFGSWVPEDWIKDIFAECLKRPQHNYFFLTKNPDRYTEIDIPFNSNFWYGTTITSVDDVERFWKLPAGSNVFICFDPLRGDIDIKNNSEIIKGVDWIIIGAETGAKRTKVIPKFSWIKDIVLAADTAGIPVFMKDSLIDIVGEARMRREFPKEIKDKTILVKQASRYYSQCNDCSEYHKKGDMIALYARLKRGKHAEKYGFLCKDCWDKHCNNLGVDSTKLKLEKDDKNGKNRRK